MRLDGLQGKVDTPPFLESLRRKLILLFREVVGAQLDRVVSETILFVDRHRPIIHVPEEDTLLVHQVEEFSPDRFPSIGVVHCVLQFAVVCPRLSG